MFTLMMISFSRLFIMDRIGLNLVKGINFFFTQGKDLTCEVRLKNKKLKN